MATKRRLLQEKKAKKMKGLRDFYYVGKSNIESAASESSLGESFDSGRQEIIQEESDGDDDSS